MSDYQKVYIREVEGKTVTLEVVEVHPDMDAIHLLLDKQQKLHSKKTKKIANFCAMLLTDYKERENSFVDAVSEIEDERGEMPAPERVIEAVELTALERVGVSSNETPLYRATFEITVVAASMLKKFKPSKKPYTSVAYGEGDWELF